MIMAWRFWHTTRRAFGDCLRLAWQNFKIVRRMQTDVVKFYFQKVDGSIREAWGTLREDIVSPVNGNPHHKKNDTVQVYFDTERQEWRCFKRLNLVG
nr:MAG TPA: hypothetical protein [Caudoviricetes sp.]